VFHVNAWGLPFTCTMIGATQVHPGPHLDAESLCELFVGEHVTYTAGVPTIWLGLLRRLDERPKDYDLSRLRLLVVGGSAAPKSMIRGFEERHGLRVLHAWGMTETTPLGVVSSLMSDLEQADVETRFSYRAKQGYPVPLVEIRARNDAGDEVPWDGKSMGELEVRGPWVARAYYRSPDSADRFTPDGWFRTGDVVTIDSRGYVEIQDRSKDLIKSGGEWISSVALENALMGHPAVAEAAVIAVPHARWQERPLAVVTALESALDALATDAATRVALLRGAGPRGFSAGADIAEFPALLEPNADTRGEGIQRLADRVEAFPKPLIVAIHGFCMGGGLEIALACDIRIAAEDARIGLPEVRIGILPGGGGTQRLPRAVGLGRARLMIFSGEPISGRRAAEWGLVEEAVGPAEVFDRAAGIARTLAAQSPHALAVIKVLLRETSGAPLRDGLRTETAAFARLLAHPDAREGIAAFLGKREPRWTTQADGHADA